ncbi:MAG: glycosyltransferase [Daejeonella sp.]|uniref:glycosyltransferase family 2 protein n=1 Tax=Daejeonella sp. TaxID=2805397 RepID=UPI00273231BE|nr:glycosyltransferase [Daejeonella sp.]MDP3469528.1 glycosyltransferase [Daejeonella sp.]
MVVVVISIISIALALAYLGLVLFLRRGWLAVETFNLNRTRFKTTVSILIAARNEEDKIFNTINDILLQDYPADLMELIVVDDHSSDRTSEIVLSFAGRGVKLIVLNENEPLNSYKKKAITEAIKLSDSELIITTDADCRMSPAWLKTIIGFYESGNYKMISSPVIYFEEKSKFEEMQTLDFLFLSGLGAAGIGNGMPSTCSGANLAYRREVFYELKGFQGIDELASGDDELFLHKVASAYPGGIGFCKSRDAIVYTHAKSSLSEFIQQRKRWASKSTKYKNKAIVLIGVSVWIFNFMIFLSSILGFFNPFFWYLCLICISIKALAEMSLLIPLCSFANRSKLLWYVPILTVLHMFYLMYIGIAGNSGKYNWKGRMVR